MDGLQHGWGVMCLSVWWRNCTSGRICHGVLAAALALLNACGSGKEQAASGESGPESHLVRSALGRDAPNSLIRMGPPPGSVGRPG